MQIDRLRQINSLLALILSVGLCWSVIKAEVVIYKRKQESKKIGKKERKQELDQESD